ncbi:hypothetical protein FZEAL_5186 [Fusarium zealandicum]|uniref:peptidyl-tRNA hydrolase n=1 Tax=Fusarium zealandicum TaxID=1053134 RepID=A0A8H4XK08_9HYPO|nr:hypothetical protein FZEAL_5186 [Fusarium zealandicum]
MVLYKTRFLVISLGNPLPKYQSLHSAGHFVLNRLPEVLQQPEFRAETLGNQTCLVSRGPNYTLVQSPTLMNVSGGFVARAWKEMVKPEKLSLQGLVVVHDELERNLGTVHLTPWQRSHKGHNGIRSIKGSLSQDKYPTSPFVRIAVGIGRPSQRDSETVSQYVLDRISDEQRRILEEDTPSLVAEKLVEVERLWKIELRKWHDS